MALSVKLSKEMAIILGIEGSELAPALVTANYTLGTGWTYGTVPDRIEKLIDGTGTVTPATQTIASGTTYHVVFNITSMSGSTATWTLGGVSGTAITVPGVYEQYITATSTGKWTLTPAATGLRMVISSLSVKAITNNTVGFTTDFNLEINKETIDITRLASAGWKEYLVDLKDWKVSFSGFGTRGTPAANEYGYDALLTSMIGVDTPVTAILKSSTTADQYTIGQALLIGLKSSGAVGDAVKYSGELQGTGILQTLLVP
jgi:predicted secreted protein